jgi:hypothetical protein
MLLIEKNRLNDNYTISLVSTGIIVGEFVKVDGFYYFCKNTNRTWGYWSEEFLKSLTDGLSVLNKELNDSIAADYINFQ